MVTGTNERHAHRHSKEDLDLHQNEPVVERQYQTEKQISRHRNTKKKEFGRRPPSQM